PNTPVKRTEFLERFLALKSRFESTFRHYRQIYQAYQLGLIFEADAWRIGRDAHAAIAGKMPVDVDEKFAKLRDPWDQIFLIWENNLYALPTPPPRGLATIMNLQESPAVQRHPVPAELE